MNPYWITFFIFLVLKLTGYLHWSWWWVTAPLWTMFLLEWIMDYIKESRRQRALADYYQRIGK